MTTTSAAALLVRCRLGCAGGRALRHLYSLAAPSRSSSPSLSAGPSLPCRRRSLSVAKPPSLRGRQRQPQVSPPRRTREYPAGSSAVSSLSVVAGGERVSGSRSGVGSPTTTTTTTRLLASGFSSLAWTPGSTRRSCSSHASPPGGDAGGGATKGGEGSSEGVPTIAIGSALRFKTIVDGKPMVPEDFRGKAVLVVNTASLCGLTPQLKELELVHKRFRGEGLIVLGVPSNDFGEQEPWEEEKIREFYAKDYGVTFPLTSKTVVVGPEAHPLYSAVVAEFGADVGPQWNFHKLLVDADGALAGVFGSNLSPLEPDLTEAIEEALPARKPEPA